MNDYVEELFIGPSKGFLKYFIGAIAIFTLFITMQHNYEH